MLDEELIKDMYRAKGNNDSYIEAGGRGYTNFKINAELVAESLVNAGWTPSSKVEHKEEGEVVLFKLNGDELILKDGGIEVRFNDGYWKWFSLGSFVANLKLHRTLTTKLKNFRTFFSNNLDQWL